ncbi:hypothetical protein H6CHR_01152 [Variovorax sp. PBL-H6]|uniref:hypothetical protein n=1 Tax=Variovorax sp. PBL-H6 TaxID=434009 RepID=UPI001318FCD0|nr:hypothetical protein [Variovorax sp. PBL-H6]VTU19290.1 hypothetical protein H6CHR_01152 [Variovorax sp. PBL-H6]
MTVPLAASLIDLVLGLELGPSDKSASNRCAVEGVTWHPGQAGAIDVRIRKLEATALRLASGALMLEIGRIALHELAGQVRVEAGVPRLSALAAAEAEFSGVKLQGPLSMSPQLQQVWDGLPGPGRAAAPAEVTARQAAADAWCLGPLGEADGTIRGKITDAHLLFDADVTVPIRHGQIDFNDATVEHVGPDSRMGVSRLGLYVDAPNGRSYLYQFTSAPIAGVEFERRGALLSPWVSERGKLELQPFAQSMLRQGRGGQGQGLTEQARLLLGRTALSGEVQLGDGRFAVPGLQVQMEGRSEGRNAVGLRSEAVGRGLAVEMASLAARNAVAKWKGAQLACDEIAAGLKLQLFVDGRQVHFALELEHGKVAAPRLDLSGPGHV